MARQIRLSWCPGLPEVAVHGSDHHIGRSKIGRAGPGCRQADIHLRAGQDKTAAGFHLVKAFDSFNLLSNRSTVSPGNL